MKTIFDYEREIISELKENEYLTIHELQKRTIIPSYQERSNFLEAIYNLELKEGIYNVNKGSYTLFPSDLYKVDYVNSSPKGLYLKRSNNIPMAGLNYKTPNEYRKILEANASIASKNILLK